MNGRKLAIALCLVALSASHMTSTVVGVPHQHRLGARYRRDVCLPGANCHTPAHPGVWITASGCPKSIRDRPPAVGCSGSSRGSYREFGDGSMGDRSTWGCGVAVRWARRVGLHELVIRRRSVQTTEWTGFNNFVSGANHPPYDHFHAPDPVASDRLSTRLQLPIQLRRHHRPCIIGDYGGDRYRQRAGRSFLHGRKRVR